MREHFKLMDGTIEGLEKMCKEIAKKYWELDFNIPVTINRRLNHTYGRYLFKYVRDQNGKVIKGVPTGIEISGKSFNNFSKFQMLDLLKHEVCHWACHVQGKPYSDGTRHFESELRRINASSTGVDMQKKGYKKKSEKLSKEKLTIRKKEKEKIKEIKRGKIEDIRVHGILYNGKFRYRWEENQKKFVPHEYGGYFQPYMKYKEYYLFNFHFKGESYSSGIGKTKEGKWSYQHPHGIHKTSLYHLKLHFNRAMKTKLKKIAIKEIEKLEIITK